jgi:membrane-associated phospholipid phosphatase
MDPLLLAVFTPFFVNNAWYLLVGAGVVVVVATAMKAVIGNDAVWKQRPPGATRCDLLERVVDTRDAGKPGFPSGHAAVSVYIAGALWGLTRNGWVAGVAAGWAAWVIASRHWKQCHTIPQLVAGGILGLLVAWVTSNIYKNK